jgi:hypothetical protein
VSFGRCRQDLNLKFGDVVEAPDETLWVFAGWAYNTVGGEAVFIREFQDGEPARPGNPWSYKVSMTSTALHKFPKLEKYLREK